MRAHLVLELKELRTLPHPDTHPFAPETIIRQGRNQELTEELGSWGWGEVGARLLWPNLAQSLSSVGGRTPGSKNLQDPSSGACFLRASRVALQRPRGPCPRSSCPQRREWRRPRDPWSLGEAAGPGALGALRLRPAAARSTEPPTPPPLTRLSP